MATDLQNGGIIVLSKTKEGPAFLLRLPSI
jgi:hypothetical protein